MADWPLLGGGRQQSFLDALPSLVADNTKSDWLELIASTSFHATAIVIMHQTRGGERDTLFDFGVGGFGSEVAIVSDLMDHDVSGTDKPQPPHYSYLPLAVPAGSRVSARWQASTSALSDVAAGIRLVGQGFAPSQPATRVLTWGADTTDSGGTLVDPGAAAFTKGAWHQIVATTDADVIGLMLGIGNRRSSGRLNAEWYIDVGIGGSGSEVVLFDDFNIVSRASHRITPVRSPFIPLSVPAGSRLSVRSSCSTTNATQRLIDVALYGLVA